MYIRKKTFAIAIVTSIVMVLGSTFASAASIVLKKESRGSKVTLLQKDLQRLGYLSEDATGYYGNATENAVKEMQKEYGYEADGIAGPVTLSLVDRLRGRNSETADKSEKAAAAPQISAAVKTSAGSDAVTSGLLKEGDENSSVKALQGSLIKLGYLNTNATSYFGPATLDAVKRLQRKYGYEVDGIVGSATLALIRKLESGEAVSAAAKTTALPEGKASSVTAAGEKDTAKTTQTNFMPKWFGSVENTFARGDTAAVYDIETGLSFNIKRTYGHNHADCETLTAKDTAIMKKIYDGTWSWERRAVIVSVDGLKIAACMTGMPHAGIDKYAANKTVSSRSGGFGRGTNLDAVKGNNMSGVFDIHFYGSKNHYNNKIDPKHQALVKKAAEWAEKNYK